MLHESHHVMQGFAFDNVNRRLFMVQAQNGTSGDDLCINQVSFSGEQQGWMHLNGAGHGVSIGVEAVGTASYIWMECDSDSALAHFPQPALSDTAVTFQGYTIYGQYLYTLDGTGHDDPADIDSYVTRIDMNTGTVKSRALTKAGSTLTYREPEGMAVYRTAAGETRLFLGFGSRDGIDRYANIFHKNVLIG